MARIVNEQNNLWGRQGKESPNPQRADLWNLNLSAVVKGLNAQIEQSSSSGIPRLREVKAFYAQSLTLPDLKVKAEEFRRDSQPYMMPTWDEPYGEVKVKFLVESPQAPQRSVVYQLLDTWRTFVRAGRYKFSEGAMPEIRLNRDYRIDYAFDVPFTLFRGSSEFVIIAASVGMSQDYYSNKGELQAQLASYNDDDDERIRRIQQIRSAVSSTGGTGVYNDLELAGAYKLVGAWLSSFRIGELNHTQGNQLLTIEASLFAETIIDETELQ